MRHLIPLLLIASLILGACTRHAPVRIASKEFAENRILAEMFVIMARESGIPVKKAIPFGNTFDLQSAIKQGHIDIYPEYTGTGLSMMGMPSLGNEDKAMAAVRDVYQQYQLTWLGRLGFNNSYVLVMQPEKATQLNVESIGDLTEHAGEITIGCEEEFMARPVDGYQPLIRRYGFNPEPKVETVDPKDKLYHLLISERIDVAVTYGTDPQIEEFGLLVLKDNLHFFPAYQGVPLVRQEVLTNYPQLEQALNKLAGLVDNQAMRELNSKVMLDGFSPRKVAEDFLAKKNLYKEKPHKLMQRKLVLGVTPMSRRAPLLVRTLDAMRNVFPNRRVEVVTTDSPAQSLLQREAFLVLMGAESFFEIRKRERPKLKSNIEAVAPVGFRFVHLVKSDRRITEQPFINVLRLGTGTPGSDSAHAARILLDAYGYSEEKVKIVHGHMSVLAEKVIRGELDAFLITASSGNADLFRILEDTRLTLQPLTGWSSPGRQYRYPFFRKARISKDVYPWLATPVETLGAQLVLTGPRSDEAVIGDGDPMSGLRSQREPIPRSIKESLIRALGVQETIDPTLPGERVTMVGTRKEVQPLNPAPGVSVLTALFLLALGVFFYRLSRK